MKLLLFTLEVAEAIEKKNIHRKSVYSFSRPLTDKRDSNVANINLSGESSIDFEIRRQPSGACHQKKL